MNLRRRDFEPRITGQTELVFELSKFPWNIEEIGPFVDGDSILRHEVSITKFLKLPRHPALDGSSKNHTLTATKITTYDSYQTKEEQMIKKCKKNVFLFLQ